MYTQYRHAVLIVFLLTSLIVASTVFGACEHCQDGNHETKNCPHKQGCSKNLTLLKGNPSSETAATSIGKGEKTNAFRTAATFYQEWTPTLLANGRHSILATPNYTNALHLIDSADQVINAFHKDMQKKIMLMHETLEQSIRTKLLDNQFIGFTRPSDLDENGLDLLKTNRKAFCNLVKNKGQEDYTYNWPCDQGFQLEQKIYQHFFNTSQLATIQITYSALPSQGEYHYRRLIFSPLICKNSRGGITVYWHEYTAELETQELFETLILEVVEKTGSFMDDVFAGITMNKDRHGKPHAQVEMTIITVPQRSTAPSQQP